jgi:hypothetical protein
MYDQQGTQEEEEYLKNTKIGNTRLLNKQIGKYHQKKNAKQGFERKLAQNIKFDSKSFYAFVRSKSMAKVEISTLLTKEEKAIETKEMVAEKFNDYFTSVFSTEDLNTWNLRDLVNRKTSKIETMEITSDNVRTVLQSLKADKSPGPDKIRPRLIMHLIDELCEPLSMIFNESLEKECVPDDWSNADSVSVPIFKTGTRSKPENDRPVGITSQVCKICEICVSSVKG